MNDRDLPAIRPLVASEFDPVPVYSVEDGRLWFSGMNARVYHKAAKVSALLGDHGYTVGPIEDDGVHAINNGGIVLSVREAEQKERVPPGIIGVEWEDEELEEFRRKVEEDVEAGRRRPSLDEVGPHETYAGGGDGLLSRLLGRLRP